MGKEAGGERKRRGRGRRREWSGILREGMGKGRGRRGG
jgi:hypothetical protein